MLTERSSVRDKQKKLFLPDFGINSSCDVTDQTVDSQRWGFHWVRI